VATTIEQKANHNLQNNVDEPNVNLFVFDFALNAQ
jgi:hypothetical protein